MREALIERLRDESLAYPHDTITRKLLTEAAAALEAAREYVAEADRRVGEQFNKAQRSEAYALEKAAETLTLTKELEAAREDGERYRWLADNAESLPYPDMWRDKEWLDAAIDQARGKGVADEA